MIEQTELVVTNWYYYPASSTVEKGEKVSQIISLDVMRKSASAKKGVACRLTCRFIVADETILEYDGEDSYVIDLEDVIDRHELLTMIRNSYSKFKEKFDLRKTGTELQNSSLRTLDESKINADALLEQLQL